MEDEQTSRPEAGRRLDESMTAFSNDVYMAGGPLSLSLSLPMERLRSA